MPTDGEGPLITITYDSPLIGASKLRGLIEAWRTRAAMMHASQNQLAAATTEFVYLKCADELEASVNNVEVTRTQRIAEEIRTDVQTLSGMPMEKSAFRGVTAVDDIMVEDPATHLTEYDDIRSVRISYTTNEIYDIYVCRKKK